MNRETGFDGIDPLTSHESFADLADSDRTILSERNRSKVSRGVPNT